MRKGGSTLASVFDVANFFIEVSPAFDDNMTQMKLYKMLYYAQGWSLVKLDALCLMMKYRRGTMVRFRKRQEASMPGIAETQ